MTDVNIITANSAIAVVLKLSGRLVSATWHRGGGRLLDRGKITVELFGIPFGQSCHYKNVHYISTYLYCQLPDPALFIIKAFSKAFPCKSLHLTLKRAAATVMSPHFFVSGPYFSFVRGIYLMISFGFGQKIHELVRKQFIVVFHYPLSLTRMGTPLFTHNA